MGGKGQRGGPQRAFPYMIRVAYRSPIGIVGRNLEFVGFVGGITENK